MSADCIAKAKRTQKQLASIRIISVFLCITVYLIFLFQDDPYFGARWNSIYLYPGGIVVLFFADWISRKVYELQVKIAFSTICESTPTFNRDSDYSVLLKNDVISDLCKKSLFFDKSGNNPYKDTWNSLYTNVSKKLTIAAFSQTPDNLTSAEEELLKLFLGLGTYGVSYGYMSDDHWNKEIHDMSCHLDVFENARSILDLENLASWPDWPDWAKRSWNRPRKLLYEDIKTQLILAYHALEVDCPSPVWDDISHSLYPCFFETPSEIKRIFCADKDLTAHDYIIGQCSRWCAWHIENYPSAFVLAGNDKYEEYSLKSSLSDLQDTYTFLQKNSSTLHQENTF